MSDIPALQYQNILGNSIFHSTFHYELHTDTGCKLYILLKMYTQLYRWVSAIHAEMRQHCCANNHY